MMEISIIIPTFNSEDTIASTIESALQESKTFKAEILVVDNGSSDNTIEIIKRFGDDNVRIIYSQPGRSCARNEGVKQSKGKYLMFLDADDQIYNNHLKRGITILEGDLDIFAYIDKAMLTDGKNDYGDVTKLADKTYEDLLKENFIHISSPIFRNKNVVPFDERLAYNEDWLFWINNLSGKEFVIDDSHYGSKKFITGQNTMNDPRMRATRIFIYGQLSKQQVKHFVGVRRIIVDMIWYKMFAADFVNLEHDIKKSFLIMHRLVGLIVRVPFISWELRQHLNKASVYQK